MHLYKLIRTQTRKGNALDPPLFLQEETEHHIFAAEQIIQEMAVGVCASVPQMTGMTAFPQVPKPATAGSTTKTPSQPKPGGQNNARTHVLPPGTWLGPTKPTGMHHLIFPLYAAGSSDTSDLEVRLYARDILSFFALGIGTLQAVALAKDLNEMQKSKTLRSGIVSPALTLLEACYSCTRLSSDLVLHMRCPKLSSRRRARSYLPLPALWSLEGRRQRHLYPNAASYNPERSNREAPVT